jgi:glycosyltransferase involved in cell wall biosynthesis
MRLLHLIGAAKPGGAETFALRLFAALAKQSGVEQHILCRQGWVAKRCAELNLPHTIAPFGGFVDAHTPWFTHRIAKQVVATFQPTHALAWMNRGVTYMPSGDFTKLARLGGFYNLKYYRGRVTELIGNTPEITTYCVAQGWPKDHVHLLHNFIPTPPPGWQDYRAAQRAAWGWKSTDIGLLMAGRLHRVKGVDVALQALAELPANFKLALVGQGPDQASLTKLADRLGLTERVTFAGWADTMQAPAAAADLWLAPSRHEPLGNTAIDAWVHEKPLIVSAVGGLNALVEDRQHGLKVPTEDPTALAQAIRTLATDKSLQKKVVQGGLARWQEQYSEATVVADYLRLLRQLCPE